MPFGHSDYMILAGKPALFSLANLCYALQTMLGFNPLSFIPNVLRSNNSEGKRFGVAELIWTAEQFICEDVEYDCVFLFSFGTFLFSLLAKKKKKRTSIDKQIKNNKMNPHQEILALIYSCEISILSLWRGELEI